MTVLVTGTTGHLGRLIIERLLARGASPAGVVAGARAPERVQLPDDVRRVELDYDRSETLARALDGVATLVLVSSPHVGQRARQHTAVVDAAKTAGVGRVVYTSILHADVSPLPLAAEHLETERVLAASGLPTTLLRHSWYHENYAPDLDRARRTGVIAAGTGSGRVASASRDDYADAAAVVALDDAHTGQTYELAGDVAWDYGELAATIGEIVGRHVTYQSLTAEQQVEELRAAGLDEGTASFVAALDAGIAGGALDSSDRTLSTLIGRPTTLLADTLRTLA